MGKKRRLLSSKKKFGVKHSSHPRVKMFATAAPAAVETIETSPTLKPVIEEVVAETAEAVEPTISLIAEEPAPAETAVTPEPILKKIKTKAKPATKKSPPARKTTRRSTKKKTIVATT